MNDFPTSMTPISDLTPEQVKYMVDRLNKRDIAPMFLGKAGIPLHLDHGLFAIKLKIRSKYFAVCITTQAEYMDLLEVKEL